MGSTQLISNKTILINIFFSIRFCGVNFFYQSGYKAFGIRNDKCLQTPILLVFIIRRLLHSNSNRPNERVWYSIAPAPMTISS